MQALRIINTGMVTGVGLDAPSSCAAIRCGINNFEETRFMDQGGEWIIGSEVPLKEPWRGRTKLMELIKPAIMECLSVVEPSMYNQIPLFLCLAEKERPGRLQGLDESFLADLQTALGIHFHEQSQVINGGRVSGVLALKYARKFIFENRLPFCMIAGVDSFLSWPTLVHYQDNERLLTSTNSNGFIPGEAGAAVLLGPLHKTDQPEMVLMGVGMGKEEAVVESEQPLRADGLVQAIKNVLSDCEIQMHDLDFRITDANGEQYYFKEAALALTRILRQRKEEFDIWHPVDCVGEVGAAIAPCIVSAAVAACRKDFAPGKRILCHLGNDSGDRAAMVLGYFAEGIH